MEIKLDLNATTGVGDGVCACVCVWCRFPSTLKYKTASIRKKMGKLHLIMFVDYRRMPKAWWKLTNPTRYCKHSQTQNRLSCPIMCVCVLWIVIADKWMLTIISSIYGNAMKTWSSLDLHQTTGPSYCLFRQAACPPSSQAEVLHVASCLWSF